MNNFLVYLEYIGIIAFAISGALEGIKHNYDFLGVIVLGITTATGGGIIRDLILGVNPPYSLKTGTNIYLAIIVSIIVFLINLYDSSVNRWTINKLFDRTLLISDAAGLAVFTITAMQVAYNIHESHSMALYVFVGVITGVGGGLIRDMFTNEVPYIFEKHVYASAAIVGAIIYHLARYYTAINAGILMLLCMALIFIIRILAYKFKWNLPKATNIVN